ncbi:hypothetical protein ARMGADRAFT_1039054 [Armillaria gallica]|uniref:Uncharacterized protein n=1 Tax=Armillaria gallica TaxID=47427 RepID=A0A2H3CKH5_ARMGA|nr:hypothetical protein ARMGADRAFT_1039054 [Armillaria gallica]
MPDERLESDQHYHSPPVVEPAVCPNNEGSYNPCSSIIVEAPLTSHEECQPTSSKVLIEDLVTDVDDDQHDQDYHVELMHTPTNEETVRFWDRPTPNPQFEWPGDHHMLTEWNMVISEMWEIDPNSKGSLFNYPEMLLMDDPEQDINNRLSFIVPTSAIKSEGPYEFTVAMYPDERRRDFIHNNLFIAPDPGAEFEARIHWYNEYEELLQGVPEGMPPWRVVNHEILLIDDSQKYHYHLPRCPNALKSEFDKKVA